MTWLIARDFALGYLAATIAVLGLAFAIEALFAAQLPSGVTTVLQSLAASLYAGDRYGARHSEPPTSGLLWRIAVGCTGVAFAISVAILVAVSALSSAFGGALFPDLSGLDPSVWYGLVIIVALFAVMHVLLVRFTIRNPIVARQQLRRAKTSSTFE